MEPEEPPGEFVFAYVDLFSLYRPDVRADIEAGEIAGFTINQAFLLGITAYVVIPSVMVFLALILRPGVNRIANIALGIIYEPRRVTRRLQTLRGWSHEQTDQVPAGGP